MKKWCLSLSTANYGATILNNKAGVKRCAKLSEIVHLTESRGFNNFGNVASVNSLKRFKLFAETSFPKIVAKVEQ